METMLTLLFFVAVAVLFVRGARRAFEDEARASHQARRAGAPRRPPDMYPGIDWKALVTPRRKKVGLRLVVAAVPGCAAVVAGGTLLGMWGLAAGTLVLATALAWAVFMQAGFRLRRPRADGDLTERERRDFDEIVARLTADD